MSNCSVDEGDRRLFHLAEIIWDRNSVPNMFVKHLVRVWVVPGQSNN